jgi:hypothetical protein
MPRTNHTCHQKTNLSRYTVPLTIIGNDMMAEIRSLLSRVIQAHPVHGILGGD